MGQISKEIPKVPEDLKRLQGFDVHSLAPLGAKNPENQVDSLDAKKRLLYSLMGPVMEAADGRLKNLLQTRIDLKQGVTHADLSQNLWDPELYEHSLPPVKNLKDWSNEIGNITEVTRTEEAKGIDVEEKRHLFGERKFHLYRQGLIREARKMIDNWIWEEHREKFERFIIEGGVGYGDIEKEMEGGFLNRYERESPMQGFVLGVGENEDLEEIYWRRRVLVDEAREVMAQVQRGGHFSSLKEHEQEGIKRLSERENAEGIFLRNLLKRLAKKEEINDDVIRDLFTSDENVEFITQAMSERFGWDLNISENKVIKTVKEDFGSTGDLLRAIRKAYPWRTVGNDQLFIENEDMAKGLAKEDILFGKDNYNDLLEGESYLDENYQDQLNKRAGIMFGQGFTSLSSSEQRMVMVGTGEVLSQTEIMRWMTDYRTSDGDWIRMSQEPNYNQWTSKKLVNKQGLYLLADMQSAMINSFGARPEIRALDKRQIDGQRNQGMGKYRWLDADLWQVFYGVRGRSLEPENKHEVFNGYEDAEAKEALVTYLKGFNGEVSWAGGLWSEWKKARRAEYEEELKTIDKYEEKQKTTFLRPRFEDWLWRRMSQRGFDSFAQEIYVSGWRLLAEKVFIQLRSEWIESETLLGLKPDDLIKTLSNDKMSQKIGAYGVKELSELYLQESTGLLGSMWESGTLGLRLALTGKDKKEKQEYKQMAERRDRAWYRVKRDVGRFALLTPIYKNQTLLGGLGMWSGVQALIYMAPSLPIIGGAIGLFIKEPMFSTVWGIAGLPPLVVVGLRLSIMALLAGANTFLMKRLVLASAKASSADSLRKEEAAEKYIYATQDENLRELIATNSRGRVISESVKNRASVIISENHKYKKKT